MCARTTRRRWRTAMGYGLAGVLVILSPSLGRAAPSGRYRPLLPADALDNGCYPLPPGVSIDFPYQVRTDVDLYLRPLRRLVLQYDEVEAVAVRDSLIATFMRAGFRERRSAGSSTSIVLRELGPPRPARCAVPVLAMSPRAIDGSMSVPAP